jgi:hypothetical protein
MVSNLQVIMATSLFALGLASFIAGLCTILTKEYQEALKGLSAQSPRIYNKALTDLGVGPMIEASSHLVEAVSQLVRTAMGVGIFLCLSGTAICLIAFWMLSRL